MNFLKYWKSVFYDQFFLHVGGGDGGGGATTSTVNQSNIPEWLRPQVEYLLGGATKELFKTQANEDGTIDIVGTKPFVPYSANVKDYVAGFSPMQEQVQANAANLQVPGQFGQATGYANQAAQGGVDSAGRAYGYGNAGFQSGQQGQRTGMQGGQYYGDLSSQIGLMGLDAQQTGSDIGNQAQQYARQAANAQQNYAAQATNPAAYQQYMNPYTQNVTDIQIEGLQRQADIARTQRGAQAARAGAFGGSRQAIENAEANRALQSQMDNVRAQGLQNAYGQAQQNLQYGANLGLQGLSGANQGLGTALQGGQLGLSGIGAAMQGQQGALQGVNTQLAGTAQGIQGAQTGLQGVSGAQAGYGLADRAAGTLGTLGSQQLAAQTGILGLQNQIGAQQQGQEQQYINQGIQNFAQAQEAPMQSFNQFNSLLRGYALPGTTTTQYQSAPTLANQALGFGTAGIAGVGLYNAMNPTKS